MWTLERFEEHPWQKAYEPSEFRGIANGELIWTFGPTCNPTLSRRETRLPSGPKAPNPELNPLSALNPKPSPLSALNPKDPFRALNPKAENS